MASGALENDLANLSLNSGSDSAEGGGGFVVCEGNKVEEFKIDRYEIDMDSSEGEFLKIFDQRLKKWNFHLKILVLKSLENNYVPVLRMCSEPYDEEEENQRELSNIPLILYKQSDTYEEFFYNFKKPVIGEFPQGTIPSSFEDISITVYTIPYIESTNGTCQLTINLSEFHHEDNTCHWLLGKPYYLLTSADGYLVKINVFYLSEKFYAEVRFIAGPNDEKLSIHFPHTFSAIIKHKDDAELDFHVGPVLKEFDFHMHVESEVGEWFCMYQYPISTYQEMADKSLINDNRVLVRFCIAYVPVPAPAA